jgi:hypothetical protein
MDAQGSWSSILPSVIAIETTGRLKVPPAQHVKRNGIWPSHEVLTVVAKTFVYATVQRIHYLLGETCCIILLQL